MTNYNLIMVAVIIVLAFSTFFLVMASVSKNAQLQQAESLGVSLKTFMSLVKENCRARSTDFGDLQICFEKLIAKHMIESDMDENDFKNYNDNTNKTGYIILTNEGKNTMNSEDFVLLKNREIADEGCVIPGAIDPQYACRLNFDSFCEPGDVLEIKYKETRAYLKTC